MAKEIELDGEYVIVDLMKKDWSVHTEAKGFHGKVCDSALDAVNQAMNATTISEQHKPEWYEETGNERTREKQRS